MVRVLMVCLGNICRSPLAEGILRSKLEERGVDHIIDSSGTSNWHVGEQPDKRSIEVASRNNIDISYQRARPFTSVDFETFDLILAMDADNYADILMHSKSENEKEKVHLFLEYAGVGKKPVPDPYFGGPKGFDKVFKMLDEAGDKIVDRILKEYF